jgi:hypothetical protein
MNKITKKQTRNGLFFFYIGDTLLLFKDQSLDFQLFILYNPSTNIFGSSTVKLLP